MARIWEAVLFLEGQTCQECGGGLASGPLGITGTVRTEHRRGVGCLSPTPLALGPPCVLWGDICVPPLQSVCYPHSYGHFICRDGNPMG